MTRSHSRKKNTDASNDTRLRPLLSQPSKQAEATISARVDSLLLQIRQDINDMVEIPTTSASKLPVSKHKYTTAPSQASDFNGNSKTTTNRLFANKFVKESLERIIYLWSIRVDDKNSEPSPYTSRYIPGLVDIIYPLYLTNLQGYIWDNHVSTMIEKPKEEKLNDGVKSISSSLRGLRFNKDDEVEDEELDQVTLSSEPIIFEDEDRKFRIKKCENLAIGIGIDSIPEEILDEVEADTYWCLENFMSAIQDYRVNDAFSITKKKSLSSSTTTPNTTGLQHMIILMEKVVQRIDPILYKHLKSNGVEYIWFSYRWLNSLHVRDMNEKCILRLFDTCMCEEVDQENGSYFSTFGFNARRARKRLHLVGFLNFQVYICAALLHRLRDRIMARSNLQDILFELRNPSLENWSTAEVETLLSQAYVWNHTFHGSEEQLVQSATASYGEDTFATWAQKCHWPPRKSTSRPLKSKMNPLLNA